jgi:hypothetical protein
VNSVFGHRPFTFFGVLFHTLNLTSFIPHWSPTTPGPKALVWAVPLSLATTYGIDSLSFPPVTEMFHFTGYREPAPMYSERDDQVLPWPGYPIRKSPGQSVLAAIRSLSQLSTSFIACWHQGIRHMLLTACSGHSFEMPFGEFCLILSTVVFSTNRTVVRSSCSHFPIYSCQRSRLAIRCVSCRQWV